MLCVDWICWLFLLERLLVWFFFFKQTTAYEMRISDWSSDVCSSDLVAIGFTSAGAKGKAIGECWDNRLSADGHFEIFIRPDLAHAPDAMPAQIAAILAHELVHAAVGIPAGGSVAKIGGSQR